MPGRRRRGRAFRRTGLIAVTLKLRSLGLLLLFVALFIVAQQFIGVLAAALIIGVVLLVGIERRPAAHLGIGVSKRTPLEVVTGFAIPCLALLVVMAPLIAFGALRYGDDDGSLRTWAAGLTWLVFALGVPAAAEEALFRGYPFQKLVELVGPVVATLAASAAFALAHGNNPSVGAFALVNIFLAGVMLSVAFLRTGSLWFATAIHLGWNWMIAGPLDLPVSGLEVFDAALYEPRHLGSPWLTGREFGPEGGLSGLLALLLVTGAVWWFTSTGKWKKSEEFQS